VSDVDPDRDRDPDHEKKKAAGLPAAFDAFR
jgi:hypothetical protein